MMAGWVKEEEWKRGYGKGEGHNDERINAIRNGPL